VTGDPLELARASATVLRDRLGEHAVAVVLGSGWAGVAPLLGEVRASVPMASLRGFPVPAVPGHRAAALSVDAGGVPVLVLAGRVHLYEGHGAAAVVHGVRAAVLSGCRTVVLTNACGSLRPEWAPGTPVLLADHLNLTGASPLCGPEPPAWAPGRFRDLAGLYAAPLREAVRRAVPGTPEGVYAGVLGGAYETPAEIRMLRVLGADLVGMSTVLEAVAAHHLGAAVCGLSLVTNAAAGMGDEPLRHEEVLARGRASAGDLAAPLRAAVAAG
jgi:purine-nucleoside phosphorylase